MIKKLNIFLCAAMAFFASCSDVDLASVNYSEGISDLKAE